MSRNAIHWEYVLLYTDDTLVVSENPESILRNEFGKYFQDSIGSPKIYLGGNVRKVQLEKGVWAWAFGSSQYVHSAVKNVEKWLAKEENSRWRMPAKAETPFGQRIEQSWMCHRS
jgi:hypothetical protein